MSYHTSCAFAGRERRPSGRRFLGFRLCWAVQLGDGSHADLGDRLLAVGLLCILARADLALELNVRAFGERGRELAKLAPNDAAMPGSMRLALARLAVLPATLGGELKYRE